MPQMSIAKPMKPSVHFFKRTIAETISLGATPPDGWVSDGAHGIYPSGFFSLDSLPVYQDFQNLFSQYKIAAVSQKLYFSVTSSGSTLDGAALPAFNNSQILMRCVPHRIGSSEVVNDEFLNQQQVVKRRLCINTMGKPVSVYTKLKTLSETYNSAVDSDYSAQWPKFISTGEASTPHYGINMHLQRIDGLQFASGHNNNQRVRIESTLYLVCKHVK